MVGMSGPFRRWEWTRSTEWEAGNNSLSLSRFTCPCGCRVHPPCSCRCRKHPQSYVSVPVFLPRDVFDDLFEQKPDVLVSSRTFGRRTVTLHCYPPLRRTSWCIPRLGPVCLKISSLVSGKTMKRTRFTSRVAQAETAETAWSWGFRVKDDIFDKTCPNKHHVWIFLFSCQEQIRNPAL